MEPLPKKFNAYSTSSSHRKYESESRQHRLVPVQDERCDAMALDNTLNEPEMSGVIP